MVNLFTWTDEAVEKLKTLHAEGLSCSQIGTAIGVTRNAVIGKTRRLRLSAPVQTQRPKRAQRHSPRPRKVTPRAVTSPPMVGVTPRGAGRAVTLMELGPNDCRALLDARSADGDRLYCGHTRGHDWQGNRSSYCPRHHSLFYLRPRKDAA